MGLGRLMLLRGVDVAQSVIKVREVGYVVHS